MEAVDVCSEVAKAILQGATHHIRDVIIYKKNVEKFEEKLKRLIARRTSMEQYVGVARRNGEKINAYVQDWSNKVDKAIMEVEKEVNALEVKARSKCFSGLCPNIKSRYRLSRKAEEAANTFDVLINECQFEHVGFRDVPKARFLTDFETFESREKVFSDIVESLKDSTVRMMGVYGMPGVGKTCLIREVYRQAQEDKSYSSVVMVTVSQKPDIQRIQGEIAESLGLKLEEKSTVGRAHRLCERLIQEKMILIILDDIWEKLDLGEVGIPFGSQHKGCKILLTSRNKNVLSNGMGATLTFQLGDLDEEEAWEFFKKMAGDSVERADLRPIAIEVAKSCAGLPLAIAIVARALQNQNISVWRDAVLQLQRPYSEIPSEKSAEVYSAIELSINHLRGEDLSTLKASCLLRHNNTNDEYFDVHDLTYIVAKSIASKDNQVFVLKEDDVLRDWPNEESTKKCNKICLSDPSINSLSDQLNCPQLFLFLLFSKDRSLTLQDDFFKEATKHKVIDLTCMQFSSLPSSICLVTSLSTLCLDGCKLGDDAEEDCDGNEQDERDAARRVMEMNKKELKDMQKKIVDFLEEFLGYKVNGESENSESQDVSDLWIVMNRMIEACRDHDKNKELLSEVSDIRISFDQLTLEKDHALKELDEEKKNGVSLRLKVSEMEKILEETTDKLAHHKAEWQKLVKEKKDMEDHCGSMADNIGRLQKELLEAKSSYNDLRAKMESVSISYGKVLSLFKNCLIVMSIRR